MKAMDKLGRLLAVAAVFALASCGSGGGAAGSAQSNSVSGSVMLDSAPSARARASFSPSSMALTAFDGSVIQLLDSSGAMVAQTTADASGQFTFLDVPQGSYTINVVDSASGAVVTSVNVALIEGDNAFIEGVISQDVASWTVTYSAGDESLQNDAQMQIAQNMADASGQSLSAVVAMREQGMGWGDIANQLGVNPGQLGLGEGHDDDLDDEKTTSSNFGSSGANAAAGQGANSGSSMGMDDDSDGDSGQDDDDSDDSGGSDDDSHGGNGNGNGNGGHGSGN